MLSRSSLLLLFAVSVFGQGVQFTVGASGLTALSHNGNSRIGAFTGVEVYWGRFDGTQVNFTCTSSGIADGFRLTCNSGSPGHIVIDVTFAGTGTDTLSALACLTNLDTAERTLSTLASDRIFSLNTTGATLTEDPNADIGDPEGAAKFYGFAGHSFSAYVVEWGLFRWSITSNGKIIFSPASTQQSGISGIQFGSQRCSTLYVRFGSELDTISTLAAPAYAAYALSFPQITNWPDRRPMATMFLASQANRSATNPRGWPGGTSADYLGAGFATARMSMLNKVAIYLNNADTISPKPQSVCWWDWGGDEFAHVFTYVGYPGSDSGSHLTSLAPELETETSGVALVDEIVLAIRARGYKPCITLRPHRVWQSGTGRPTGVCYAQGYFDGQVYIDTSATYPSRGYECRERTVTFDDATDRVLCATCDLLQNGSVVRLYATSGSLPTALSSSTDYYIQNFVSQTSFQISTDEAGTNIVTDFSGGSGTFQQESWRGPATLSTHEATHSYADALDMMTQAVRYAQNRWGNDVLFYVDSTYYKTNGQNGRTDTTIGTHFWRQLSESFPGTLFMPENSPHGGGHAKYLSTNNGTLFTNPSWAIRRLYPETFSAVALGGNYAGYEQARSTVRQGMQQGDIYLLNINAFGPVENQGKADLATALAGMRTITMTDRGQARTFRSDPGAAFRYPLISRVYFAASAEGLAASTTYCERKETDRCYLSGVLQDTPTLDLSTRPYYQIRYYDYAGGLPSNPSIYGVIQ